MALGREAAVNYSPFIGLFQTLIVFSLLLCLNCLYPSSVKEELGSNSRLRFTNGELGYYNVTIIGNKDAVHCNMKLGMYVYDHRVEIIYSFLNNELSNGFTLHQTKIANFAFFKLTRNENGYGKIGSIPDQMIIARNKKNGEKIDTTRVHFNVIMENKHRPIFISTSINATIMDNLSIGDDVARVVARDEDAGLNGQIYYFIPKEQTTVVRDFSIHPETGVISLINYLSFSRQNHFRFDIQARDRCVKKDARFFSRRLSVDITILSSKSSHIDLPSEKHLIAGSFLPRQAVPRPFSQLIYVVNMTELAPPSTSVIALKLNLKDGDNSNRCLYGLNGGNENGHFQINSKTGLIYTNSDLDYEMIKQHRLSVFGSYGGMFVARTTVVINVQDANDNTPHFNKRIVDVTIDENIAVGDKITTVLATDLDSRNNGLVTYALANVNQTSFDVSSSSGKVFVARPLDRDTLTPALTVLRIRASDRGIPFRRQSDVFVRITVRDVNDNPPVLKNNICNIFIGDAAKAGTQLLQVEAMDIDITLQSTYFLLRSSPEVDNTLSFASRTGMLTLHADAATTALKNGPIFATILASDGDHTSSMPLNISIHLTKGSSRVLTNCSMSSLYLGVQAIKIHRDAFLSTITTSTVVPPQKPISNSYIPVFGDMATELTFKEDLPIGTEITKVRATDKDRGCLGVVVYSIFAGNEEGLFQVDVINGSVSLSNQLNYEKTKNFRLTIRAWDDGNPRRFSQKDLNIKILDVNDNAPVFNQSIFTVRIKENLELSGPISKIEAIDKDGGENGRVTYSFVSESSLFSLDSVTGELRLLGYLDREQQSDYWLGVLATDNAADSPKSSNAKIHIIVEDVNDCKPQCYPPSQTLYIPKDYPTGSVIGRVMAFDNDSDSRGTVQYKLMIQGKDHFIVHSRSGVIQITKPFQDFEERFQLTIQVSDGGIPSLSTSCVVTIQLYHHGLYARPEFTTAVDYAIVRSIHRVTTIATSVLSVSALVEDGADIIYDIVDGSGLGKFHVNPETGTIKTRKINFLEKESFFWLTIQARLKQDSTIFSNIHAIVYVKHNNLQLPYFNPSVYHANIIENSPIDSTVAQLYVIDPNSYNLPSNLHYSIVDGDPFSQFSVTDNGFLITKFILDYEISKEYLLNISVTVPGYDELKSYCIVYVSGIDENDNTPTPLTLYSTVPVIKGSTEIGQVIAFDKDSGINGQLRYKQNPVDDNFSIDEKTGIVTSKNGFSGNSFLTIAISDSGNPPRSEYAYMEFTTAELPVQSPSQFNFDRAMYEFTVTEGKPAIERHIDLNHVLEQFSSQNIFARITSGNEDHMFASYIYNKKLYAIQDLDYETKSKYLLRLEVSDGLKTVSCDLSINIIDVYEAFPVMTSQPCYEASIIEGENTKINELIQIEGVPKYGQKGLAVNYNIVGGNRKNILKLFHVEQSTGLLRNHNIKTDREVEDIYVITVSIITVQKTERSLSGAYCVVLKVEDVNDNAPSFLNNNYEIGVSDFASPTTPLLSLTATDSDTGLNAMLTYSIENGNDNTIFRIDSTSGVVYFNERYRSRGSETFNMLVKVSDNGIPKQSSTTNVKINVYPGKQLLAYSQKVYNVSISENSANHSVIFHESNVTTPGTAYRLISPTNDQCITWFHVDSFCGVVTSLGSLDAEIFRSCSFNIIARDIVSGHQNAALLHVHIIDVNDNSPLFYKESYNGYVMEGFSRGSDVVDDDSNALSISAIDKDYGKNSIVKLEILEQDAERFFLIDSTGSLKTRKVLDRETKSLYRFHIKASDTGDVPLVSYAVVNINVRDLNDQMPEFTQSTYDTILYSPIHNGTVITTVSASDSDSITFGNVTYHLQNHKDILELDSTTGVVTVTNSYRLQNDKSIQASITATDGIFSSSTFVKVTVKDSIKSGFQFTKSTYTATVKENEISSGDILVLEVVGNDISDCVTFSRLNVDNSFSLDSIHGVLRVNPGIIFDREVTPYFMLHVQAINQKDTPLVAQALINVTIIDVNDNPPRFKSSPYYRSVDIDTVKDTPILNLEAIDLDAGPNAVVRYELVSGSTDLFTVNSATGILSTKRDFIKGRTESEYKVVVKAQDMGQPVLSEETTVILPIVNKDTPVFKKAFNVSVAEDAEHGFLVVMAIAIGPQSRPVYYSIVKGDGFNMFSINFNTGEVSVLHKLDSHKRSSYDLTIRAIDSLTGSWSETSCFVLVTDVNDHAPLFRYPSYNVTIREDASIGVSLLRVTATDLDQGMNAAITYSLSSNHQSSSMSFSVDSESGDVRIVKQLDYEIESYHTIAIHAKDRGKIPLESFTYVRIILIDVNDNSPIFHQDEFKFYVDRFTAINQFIGSVSAYDVDWINTYHLSYTIDSERYQIEKNTGILSFKSAPNSGTIDRFNVSCSDGDHVIITTIAVSIGKDLTSVLLDNVENVRKISAIQENRPPYYVTLLYSELMIKSYEPGTKFEIESDILRKQFAIGANNSHIRSLVTFDSEVSPTSLILPIRCSSQSGHFSISLLNITLKDENDNAPEFEFTNYYGVVTRDMAIGSTILTVHATDLDHGKNAEVTYTTEGLDDQSALAVNKDSGEIKLTAIPQGKLYQFVVKATDNGYPVREASTLVKINVLQPEERSVKFVNDKMMLNIREDHRVGSRLETISANVKDGSESIALGAYYELIDSQSSSTKSKGLFEINSNTGVLMLKQSLDYETTQIHRIMIKASMHLESTLPSYSIVTIIVENINDNPPVLGSSSYSITLSENVKPGSKVLLLSAHDRDLINKVPPMGYFLYSMKNATQEIKEVFNLDPKSGWLSIRRGLDREKMPGYVIPFSVSDGNAETSEIFRTFGTITIQIIDVNDCAPSFSKPTYKFLMREDFLVDQKVGQVYASDEDVNSQINYYLDGSDGSEMFQIDRSTGDIRVAAKIHAERITQVTMKAIAFDGIHSSSTEVIIVVQDTNDNQPNCRKAFYNESVSEMTPSGGSLFQILADDVDRRDELLFLVQGDGTGKFSVDARTGMLSSIIVLDHEKQSQYHFKVVVTDKSGHSCNSDVFLEITDVNDNRPIFTQKKYLATVRESVSLSVVFTHVQAVDIDEGINGRVTYSLQSTFDNTFQIGLHTGLVSVEKGLSKVIRPSYTLNVIASDGGSPALESSVPLNVVVLSKDDKPPRFSRTSYTFNVSESAIIGESVGIVSASPSDENKKEDIRYVIIIGEDICSLDQYTGVLTLRKSLDYERNKYATVSVKAEFSFAPSLASIVTVILHVNDVNDNTPQFGQALIARTIDENVRPNSFVLQALATDSDTGENGHIIYKILSPTPNGLFPFIIKNNTGAIHISSTGSIDRERQSSYLFTVQAADNGEPKRKSNVLINITVADLNDNAPSITITNTTVVLQQSTPVGSIVIELAATDADSYPNGAPFSFLLTEGDNELFSLRQLNQSACAVVTKQLLPLIDDASHSLIVRTRDNGSPPQSIKSYIDVVVVRDSMFVPELSEPTTFSVLLQNGMRSLTIGMLSVIDKDAGDFHTFSIVSGNENSYFSVGQVSGKLEGNSLIPGLFTVGVQVTDGRFNDGMVINIVVHNETQAMYDNSVIVSINGISADDIVKKRMSSIGAFLSRITGSGLENINIWSVQTQRRQRRDTDSESSEIAFAVKTKQSKETYMPASALRLLLMGHRNELRSSVGAEVTIIDRDMCASSPCPADEECLSVVQLIDNSPTKSPSIQSREFQSAHKCLCLVGSQNPSCPLFNPCNNDPCPIGEKCLRDGNSYECQCLDEKLCSRGSEAITLDGSGYVRYQLKGSFDKLFRSISLEFRTEEKTGTLFYARENDYCILEVVSGLLQFRFDLGSGPGLVVIKELQVDDGDWHSVEVQRSGNYVALLLDNGKYRSSGKAGGNLAKIDLLGNTFYLGTSVVPVTGGSTARRKRDGTHGSTYDAFKGCLRNPKLNTVRLPWTGANDVIQTAQSYRVKDNCKDSDMCRRISCPYFSQCINTLTSYICQCLRGHAPKTCRPIFTCKDLPCQNGGTCTYYDADDILQYRCHCPMAYTGPQCQLKVTPCSNNPCQNNGECREVGTSYICTCDRRFKGRNCELDTDPCYSKPCFRNAKCSNLGLNRFTCDCDQSTFGQRCGFGEYCSSYTCTNGGSCIETFDGAKCSCPTGYTGQRCETDINECLLPNTCESHSTCINTFGGHYCNCTQSSICNSVAATVVTSPGGMSLPTIIGAVSGLLVIIIIIIVVFCFYRKHQRRVRFQRRTAGEHPDVKYPLNCYPSTVNEYEDVPQGTPQNPTHRPPSPFRQPPGYFERYDGDFAMADTDFYDPSAIGNTDSTVSSKSDCAKSPFSESACSVKERVDVINESERDSEPSTCMYAPKPFEEDASIAERRSLSSEYHWDYSEVPEDVRLQSNRKMSREGSYMAIPLTEAPSLPRRARRSSVPCPDQPSEPPAPPDLPRNLRLSRQSLQKSETASPTAMRHQIPYNRGPSVTSNVDNPIEPCTSELSLTQSYPGVNTDLTRGDFANRYTLTTGPSKNSVFQPIGGVRNVGNDDDDDDDVLDGPSRRYFEPDQSEISISNDGLSQTSYNSDDDEDDDYDNGERDPLDPDDTRRLVRDIKVLFKEIKSKTEDM